MFFSLLAVQPEKIEIITQEEIAEGPALQLMTEKQLNDLFGEKMYLGETDWRGKKFELKGITTRKRKKDSFRRGSKYTNWSTLQVRLFSV